MKTAFFFVLGLVGIGFALFFFITVGPLLIGSPDVISAFKAGYVNPYAAGFATDAIACWLVLATWVIYEKFEKGVRYGWIALVIGLVPGVASAFALYLVMRTRQLKHSAV